MVAEKLSQNVKDRFGAGKDLLTGQIDIVKTVVGDVFNVAKGQEATLPRKVNFPGVRGGLIDEIPAVIVGTGDNLSKFVHKQIEITRRWV